LGSLVKIVNVIYMSLLHYNFVMGLLCIGQSCKNCKCNLHVSVTLHSLHYNFVMGLLCIGQSCKTCKCNLHVSITLGYNFHYDGNLMYWAVL